MTTTTIPGSERGRAVRTRVAIETLPGVLPSSGWKPARFYSLTAGMERGLVKDDQLGVPQAGTRATGTRRRGLPGGSLSRSVPLNLSEIGLWLAAGFNRVAPSGSGDDYVHVFDSTGDPTATLSLVQEFGPSDFAWDTGAALAEIRIQAAKGEGTARADLTLVPLKDGEGTSAPAGTLAAAYAEEDFADWRWRALWNDVVVGDATGVDVNIALGVERVNGLSGDEWPTRHHFGEIDTTGTFRLYGRAPVFRDLAATGGFGKLTLEATHPADPAGRFFRVEMDHTQLTKPQRSVQNGGMMSSDMRFEAAETLTPQVKISLGNGVASY